ncbi:MAG: hypothetical protein ACK4SX_14040 [Alcanivoracaceae bacterium]
MVRILPALFVLIPLQILADDLSAWLGPRPKIENYQDRDAFVSDILLWRKERDLLAARAQRGELPALPAGVEADHDPDDWHRITGPEDLETAVQKAHGYEQPHYQEPLRFNRTTHVSFPLEQLPMEALSTNAVDGTLEEGPAQPAKQARDLPARLMNELDDITRLPASLAEPGLSAFGSGVLR